MAQQPEEKSQKTAPEVFVLSEMLSACKSSTSKETAPILLAASDPEPEKLSDMLKKSTKEAPSSTSISAVPSGPTPDEIANLQLILMLNSYANVAAMRMLYKENPKGWDITDPKQASDFVKKSANAKFRTITEALGGFLSQESTTAKQFSKSTTSADLHLEFLGEIFKGFNFPATTMTQLDSLLTNVVKTLSNLKVSFSSQSESLDHVIVVFYFDDVAGIEYKLPRLRLFYLHIDQKSWEASVGKSSVKHFEFNMNYVDNIFLMDPTTTKEQAPQIRDLIAQLTGQSFDAINDLLSPSVAKTDN